SARLPQRLADGSTGLPRAGSNRHGRRNGSGELQWIDVDPDEPATDSDGMRLRIHFRLAELGADCQHDITLCKLVAQRCHGEIARKCERMIRRQDALAVDSHEYWCIEIFGDGPDVRGRVGSTATGNDKRSLCHLEQCSRLAHRLEGRSWL